jgi:putative oxidoreductase
MGPRMFVAIGRILFAVLFVFSGASKLLDIAGTAQGIADKVVIPAVLATYTGQLETMTGMPISHLLAIAAGATEVICGLMIALNFGARFFAIVLILFIAAATLYYHNFWDMSGADSRNNMIHALKNLSLIGALFIIAGYPRSSRSDAEVAYTDH